MQMRKSPGYGPGHDAPINERTSPQDTGAPSGAWRVATQMQGWSSVLLPQSCLQRTRLELSSLSVAPTAEKKRTKRVREIVSYLVVYHELQPQCDSEGWS